MVVVSGRTSGRGVVDLFSGCGGLSLGFSWVGFEVEASVELDPAAAATHHANFRGPVQPGHSYHRDILTLDPHDMLADELGGASPQVLVGGPPCQAFARIGRAKLREVAGANGNSAAERAHLDDPRAKLWQRYLHFVDVLQPKALLMENVPDILNHGGVNVAEAICAKLDRFGYEARYTVLNAANYGVPQFRERMFLVAYRREAGFELPASDAWWPAPTHGADLPRGYLGTRAVASRVAGSCPRFDPPSDDAQGCLFGPRRRSRELDSAVSVRQALAGVPGLDAASLGRGRRDLPPSEQDPGFGRGWSDYSREMRSRSTPANRQKAKRLSAHVTRHLPRDFEIFDQMEPGQDYVGNPDVERFRSVPEIARSLGRVVPYDESKFPNKWWKMRADRPSRTLTAHIGKDTYSHIHFAEPRTISVREAARLQSFPDAFRFECSMNAGFRMIGNAVPPLMAEALAKKIRLVLGASRSVRRRGGGIRSATASS